MAQGLSATVDTKLATFNTLALQTQDEAYTLAYYLLGDERHAERATQAAFDQLYRSARLQADRFRFEVLRGVLDCCRRMISIMPSRAGQQAYLRLKANRDATFEKLLSLNDNERSVVVLVDVLGLDYEAAAEVLGSSKKQVSSLLAQARLNLSRRKIRQGLPEEETAPLSLR